MILPTMNNTLSNAPSKISFVLTLISFLLDGCHGQDWRFTIASLPIIFWASVLLILLELFLCVGYTASNRYTLILGIIIMSVASYLVFLGIQMTRLVRTGTIHVPSIYDPLTTLTQSHNY